MMLMVRLGLKSNRPDSVFFGQNIPGTSWYAQCGPFIGDGLQMIAQNPE